MQEYSRGAVIFKKFKSGYKVLLIKQINGNWGFPKGHMEDNETDYDTAKREIFEETSLTEVKLFDYSYESNYQLANGNNKNVKYFLAYDYGKKQPRKQESELLKLRYYPISRAINVLTFKTSKQILKNAWIDFKKCTIS
ncbi:NUDIX domain-containing protein [Mycoplasma sp. NEAQ87857]|uniref:NUDIX domain-containing protein n=1 Tax=Mycoplasma sp. NEAQ87857 TaxID=2683967 RepID=UPI001317B629|nr:NUDIX domain-containing protein [Mycoplasma sp. NEAQ87857]QGZ97538.1 NUDIX domain-containing protein [Mycoplasma sp. NEAQ87857]